MKKLLSFTLAITFIFATLFCVPASANAEAKPVATTITSLKAGTKSFTVKWKKKSVKGYQIQYSTSSSFKNSKKYTLKNGNATTKKISNLKAKKRYYVRVRTYKFKDGEKVFSSWSNKRYVTTKASSTKKKRGTVVYITPTGKKYHYSKSCAGKNAIKTTLSEARKTYDPCKKCAS